MTGKHLYVVQLGLKMESLCILLNEQILFKWNLQALYNIVFAVQTPLNCSCFVVPCCQISKSITAYRKGKGLVAGVLIFQSSNYGVH